MDEFLDDNYTLFGGCTGSPFMVKDYIHIRSSNLKIINENNLCKLFSKGPKRRKKISDYQKANYRKRIKEMITTIKSIN